MTKTGLPPLPRTQWEICGICRYGAPAREMREIKYKGRRVRVCHKCWCDIVNEGMSEGGEQDA